MHPLDHLLIHLVMLHSDSDSHSDIHSDGDKDSDSHRDSYSDRCSNIDSDSDIVGHVYYSVSTGLSPSCSTTACYST